MYKTIHNASDAAPIHNKLGDFTADGRTLVLITMALFVGMAGTGAAWTLLKLIALVNNLTWLGRFGVEDIHPGHGTVWWWIVLAPAVGGLIIGLMARYGSQKIRGHGIPEAIEVILIGGSRMNLKVAILKPLSSAISIGTGGPFGAEGPIIMTGGAIGSLAAQCFHLSAAERKTLLVAGAAAGMTAIFATPIAAVLLAVELLLFEWKPRSFIPVVAAVLVAISFRPLLLGHGPLFAVEIHPALPAWGLLVCVLAGIFTGLQSGAMTKLLYTMEDQFERLPIHWMWWPALGGLVVGVGGLIEPRALGVGYDIIGDLLSGHMIPADATRLLLVKSVIWIVALSSGTSGGVLAPLLILGGTAGWLEGQILPGGGPFWALLGMAAMMGGTMRAPLTGVMFAIELTGNLGLLVPLLAATGSAYAVTVLLLKRSILTEKIARRGQHITCEYSIDSFQWLRVSEVMVTQVDTLRADMTVDEVVKFFTEGTHRHKSYPVLGGNGELVGMAARSDVLRWQAEQRLHTETLDEVLSDTDLTVGYPDELLGRLVDRMVAEDVGRVPVVSGPERRLVGLVTRKDILRGRAIVSTSETLRERFLGPARKAPVLARSAGAEPQPLRER